MAAVFVNTNLLRKMAIFVLVTNVQQIFVIKLRRIFIKIWFQSCFYLFWLFLVL